MIALEWNVETIRRRGEPFECLSSADQRDVLTHHYRRVAAKPYDRHTREAATPLDLARIVVAQRPKRREATAEDNAAAADTLSRLASERDARRGKGGGRGD